MNKVFRIEKDGTAREIAPWSPSWCLHMLHSRFVDVLDWFRDLPGWWRHNVVAFRHGRESPGCVHQNPYCVEHRWDPERGSHFYCTSCLRRVGPEEQ